MHVMRQVQLLPAVAAVIAVAAVVLAPGGTAGAEAPTEAGRVADGLGIARGAAAAARAVPPAARVLEGLA